jgi:tetratricopeptide (TPR) repeat protein
VAHLVRVLASGAGGGTHAAMPSFLYEAAGPEGEVVRERIEAENLGQAGYLLKVRGYRDVRFFTDENAGDMRRLTEAGANVSPADPADWTPDDEVELMQRKGAWGQFWWAFRQHLFVVIPLCYWNFLSLRAGPPFAWLDYAGFVATPLYLGYFLFLAAPGQVFHQILDASVWHDWRRLRFFTRLARLLRSAMGMGIPETELRVREATALADEGKLDEALGVMEAVRTDPNNKPYLYLARLAGVYQAAGQFDRQIACLRESQAQSPGGASEWIDLAMALVRRGHDVAGAKAALAQAKEKEMPELAKAFVAWCDGIIACEERDFARAKRELETALELTGTTGTQLMVAVHAHMHAYLCIACAGCGEGDEARRLWSACRAILVAQRETELIGRCRAALAALTTRSSA